MGDGRAFEQPKLSGGGNGLGLPGLGFFELGQLLSPFGHLGGPAGGFVEFGELFEAKFRVRQV